MHRSLWNEKRSKLSFSSRRVESKKRSRRRRRRCLPWAVLFPRLDTSSKNHLFSFFPSIVNCTLKCLVVNRSAVRPDVSKENFFPVSDVQIRPKTFSTFEKRWKDTKKPTTTCHSLTATLRSGPDEPTPCRRSTWSRPRTSGSTSHPWEGSRRRNEKSHQEQTTTTTLKLTFCHNGRLC